MNTTIPETELEMALEMINQCEQELARTLTLGQRRDLLKDNFDWTSAKCDRVVCVLHMRGAI